MKFMKKYGIYITLFAVTAILGSAGYISETKREEEIRKQVINAPEEKYEEPLAEPASVYTEVKAETPPPQKKEVKYIMPVSGEAYLGYSENEFIYSKTMGDFRTHTGLDFMCNSGEKIAAVADGVISDVYNDDFFGLCIEIEHPDGIVSRYCSLSETLMKVGDNVNGGESIAIAGNTSRLESAEGIHLHFEVFKDGKPINPEKIFSN